MKLKRAQKGLSDIKTRGERNRTYAKAPPPRQVKVVKKEEAESFDYGAYIKGLEDRRNEEQDLAKSSPVAARAIGKGYTGPDMPDKGQRNGSCNVTACQMPLAGFPQFSMDSYGSTPDGKFYYCADCEPGFTKWDRIDRPGQPLRCTPVLD